MLAARLSGGPKPAGGGGPLPDPAQAQWPECVTTCATPIFPGCGCLMCLPTPTFHQENKVSCSSLCPWLVARHEAGTQNAVE